jgi:hypothetical protein
VTHQGCSAGQTDGPASIAMAMATAAAASPRWLQWRCNRCWQVVATCVHQTFLRRAGGRDHLP